MIDCDHDDSCGAQHAVERTVNVRLVRLSTFTLLMSGRPAGG